MRKVYLLFFVLIMAFKIGNAQTITNYTFAASNGTFTPVTGGTTVSGMLTDTYISGAIPIGFPFVYMGNLYTNVYASSNGFISFNPTSASETTNNLATSSTVSRPIVAPLWDDMDGRATGGSTASYSTTGTPGSRVFTFEWLNWEWNFNSANPVISFQVKLYEGSGIVQFIYRPESGNVNSGSASIGITAAVTGSGNYLSLNGTTASPTVSSTSETNNINSKPASGQTYTFTPPPAPIAPTALNFSNIGVTKMTLNWTDNAANEAGYGIFQSTDGINYTLSTSVPANVTTATVSGLNAGTTYYWQVFAFTEGTASTPLAGSQATIAANPLGGIYTINNTQPTAGTNFNNFTDAFNTINDNGISGTVTFNVYAGQTFTEIVPILIATGTASNTITFQKFGSGSNPIVQRTDAGTLTTSAFGGQGDAVITVQGSDHITFNGIDLTATNAGVEYGLLLRKSSGTNGCKYVIFKNGNVTLTRPTSGTPYTTGIYISNLDPTSAVSSATGVTVTSTGGRHENIVITGNTISNVFYGVQARGYAHGSPYNLYDTAVYLGQAGAGNGNTISNFGGLSTTAVYGIYFLQVNDAVANYNTINNTDNGGVASTGTIYGIYGSTGNNSTLTATGNNISLGSAYTSGSIYGVYNSAYTGNFIVDNNTISLNNNVATSGAVAHIYNGSATAANSVSISNNVLGNSSYNSTTTCYVIYNSVTNSAATTINNNAISGIAKTGSGALYVYYDAASPAGVETFSNNNVYSLTNQTAALYGYYSSTLASHRHNVYNNNIYNLSCGGITYAIYKNYGTGNIYKNKVYDITTTSASSIVAGIYIGGTSNVKDSIYNNIIADLKATAYSATSNSNGVIGIYSASAVANSTIGIYYNTILIDASSSGANFGSSGIYLTGNATATTAAVELKNNLVINNSTASGTGKTVVLRRSSTALANFVSTSNNNLYYTSSGSLFYDGTNEDPDLATYKSRVAPSETASISESPVFVSVTGSDATYLHINASTPTQIESGGNPVGGITQDFDGDTRNVTTPDIGADEFNGLSSDQTGPSITYTALPVKNLCISAPVISATITDASGINTTAGTRPRLWFKKSTELDVLPVSNTSAGNGWKYVEASNSSSPFIFNFDFSLLTSPVINGDSISYFIAAQDLVGVPNVSFNTVTLNNVPASVALSASAFPASGSIKGFSFLPLPNPLSIKANISELCISGSVTLNVNDADVTGGEYQWQSSPMGANTWSDILNATTIPYTTDIITSNTDFRLVVKCGGIPISTSPSSKISVTINNPQVASSTGATRCGPGILTLAATGSAGTTLNWYDAASGGTALSTGNNYITPSINTTTTYYVSAQAGASSSAILGAGGSTSTNAPYCPFNGTYGGMKSQYLFTAAELTTAGLNSGAITSLALDITTAGGAVSGFTIQMGTTSLLEFATPVNIEGGLTTVYSSATFTPATGINTFSLSNPFSWDGVSNVIVSISWSNNTTSNTSSSIKYDATTNYSSQSYRKDNETSANMLAFTGATGSGTFSLTRSQNRPKMTFVIAACESARVPVIATVSTSAPITASATSTTVCAGQSTQLNVTSTNAGYTYVWNPGNLAGASQTVSPTANTTYTVTATDNSGGPSHGCSNTADVTISTNPLPSAVTITPASTTICVNGDAQLLTANGGAVNGGVVLSENFNGAMAGWTTTNTSTGTSPANAEWTLRTSPYTPGGAWTEALSSNDNSQFILTNSDAVGSGASVATTLTSPAFSTIGFTSCQLEFYHYFRARLASTAKIEVSSDGTNWTTLQTYTTTNTGSAAAFALATFNLDAYAGDPTVYIRFVFNAGWDWGWAIDNVLITGNQPAGMTWSPIADLFTDAAATIPYTGTATTTVYAKPSATATYTATATNSFACTTSNTATITVTTPPSATISYAGSPYCNLAGTASVTQTGTTGGTYSSTTGLAINTTNGEIDLGASTPGTYIVTYTVTAGGGCSQYQTTSPVTISVAPSATISYPASPYCTGGGTATVTQTGTTGGTYSSTSGLSIDGATGEITLTTSTPGTYTVTYTIVAAAGCPIYTTTTQVTISNSPSATISYTGSPYCSNGVTATVTQTGSLGGVYSSTAGLTIDGSTGTIDIATSTPGTYTVTYFIAAANGCSSFTTTTSVTINTAPSATISYGGSPYCSNAATATVTHTGTPGGTYSSTTGLSIDATTGTINIAASTAGNYIVTYTVAAANGCAVYTTTTNVAITAAPTATINYAGSPYCSNGTTATVTRTGTPGGTYSSTTGLSIDATTGAINIAASIAGNYVVTYTVAAANGCAVYSTTANVTITAAPSATISYAGSPYCSSATVAAVTHTGTTGGTFSSTTGLSIDPATGTINPSASTVGAYTVTYTVVANGCAVFSTTTNVTITTLPSATISYVASPYCGNGANANVTRTGTPGGTYSSTTGLSINPSTGTINLAASTPGTYTVTYSVPSGSGCAAVNTTTNVTITTPPAATISYAGSPYCSNGTTATVTQTGTTGGTYSSSTGLSINATTGAINLAASTAGTYVVTYTIAASGGCTAVSTTANVTITAAPSATISYAGSPYCGSSGIATATQTGNSGGTYSSTTGLSINANTGAINLATSTPGTYTVTYTLPAANGCAVFTTTATVSLTSPGTWTGLVSTDWNNAANWCGGIPSAATDAVIPSTAPNMPNLGNGSGSVKNIIINTGGSLTIGTGGVLDLYGNITGTGTFTATNGSINFRGSANQSVPAFTATNVTMNGAGGNSGVTLGGNTSITGTLTLTNGNITLGANNLSLGNSSNGTISSHIVTNGSGNVIVTNLAAAQTRVIPIGNNAASYNPVTLTANPGHATDNFTVRVQQGVYENGVSGTTFTTHVADRMWIINEATAGGSNVNIMLQWAGSQELQSFTRSKNYIMQHNGTGWVAGTATAAGGTDPYTQTKAGVTSFGAFAVETERIPQPVTGIYPNPASDYIYVVTDLLSTGPVAFSVYDDKGTLVYRKQLELTVGLNQTRLDIGHLSAGVYLIKVTTRLNDKFLSQRFLKVN